MASRRKQAIKTALSKKTWDLDIEKKQLKIMKTTTVKIEKTFGGALQKNFQGALPITNVEVTANGKSFVLSEQIKNGQVIEIPEELEGQTFTFETLEGCGCGAGSAHIKFAKPIDVKQVEKEIITILKTVNGFLISVENGPDKGTYKIAKYSLYL